ncbi:LPP20 family lipoprotein [uncultured Thalassolituus sp.]|uniref:LPP20 family lipoprotein n=1 Tax=uncultured Thalassolituus sp. TaxID=285273 RepID=UPI002604016F|nr:LPP20 family lipoprotein [uncultured Thalassolituus sp.]
MIRHFRCNFLIASCSAVLLAGCSGLATTPSDDSEIIPDDRIQASALPGWVTDTPDDKKMAYGVGSMEIYGNPDQALKRASDFARADLVSRLKVTVSAETSSTTSEYSLNGETSLQKSVSQAVSSRIPTVTLDEVEIRDTYVDNRYAYALASLDRVAATSRLQTQMQDIESQLQTMSQQPVSGTGKLERLQQQLPALTLFARHDKLAQQYALIAISRRTPQVSTEMQDFRRSILAAVKDLNVRLVLMDDGAKIMRGGLTETLTAQGLRLSTVGVPDLTFEVSAVLDSRQQEGNYYVFANARVNLRDPQGRVLSSFSDTSRGISGMQQTALHKASEALAQKLSGTLAETLTERLQ